MWKSIVNFFIAIIVFFLNTIGINNPFLTVQTDYAYASVSADQKMDIYSPSKLKYISEPVNVVLFIHGGGWTAGDKSDGAEFCKNSARQGFVAVSMNYRLIKAENLMAIDCDDMLDDVDSAVSAIKKFLSDEGVTVNKMMTMGVSAGGHLAMLYSYSRQSPIPIGFCTDIVGPSDLSDPMFFKNNELLISGITSALTGEIITPYNYTDKKDALLKISPVSYTSTAVPTILAYGALDNLVPVSNAVSIDNALTASGISHKYLLFPNSGHALESDPDLTLKLWDYINEYSEIYL